MGCMKARKMVRCEGTEKPKLQDAYENRLRPEGSGRRETRMNICFLGTCSGTEPIPGRRHTSVLLETGGAVYVFDAGEGCAHTAHLLGYDLRRVRRIVISHPHMDHVGGLGNLLWTIRKLRYIGGKPLGHDIEVHTPCMDTFDGFMKVLKRSEGKYVSDFAVIPRPVRDGPVFEDPGIRVSAMHNGHLAFEPGEGWLSYSFLIECEEKKIVYSGDIKEIAELDPWMPCDALLVETGHHVPAEIAMHAAGKGARKLIYMHHGRTIMDDPAGQLAKVRAIFGESALITDDGTTLSL